MEVLASYLVKALENGKVGAEYDKRVSSVALSRGRIISSIASTLDWTSDGVWYWTLTPYPHLTLTYPNPTLTPYPHLTFTYLTLP